MSANTVLWIQALGSIMTVAVSMIGAAFIYGNRWGRLEADMRLMAERVAKIEGMFVLVLKEPDKGR